MTTLSEILKACASGEMPAVEVDRILAIAQESTIGRVTVIKDKADGGGHRGIAVRFPGMKYDIWFADSDATDGRTKYLRELTICS